MPNLVPAIEFFVETFSHELAKYLNFTVRRSVANLPRTPLRPLHQLLLLERATALPMIEISAVGLEQHEACTCLLAVGDRVLLDSADEGWLAGCVSELAGGMVHVDIDANLRQAGQSDRLVVPRNGDLYKARAQTCLLYTSPSPRDS